MHKVRVEHDDTRINYDVKDVFFHQDCGVVELRFKDGAILWLKNYRQVVVEADDGKE